MSSTFLLLSLTESALCSPRLPYQVGADEEAASLFHLGGAESGRRRRKRQVNDRTFSLLCCCPLPQGTGDLVARPWSPLPLFSPPSVAPFLSFLASHSLSLPRSPPLSPLRNSSTRAKSGAATDRRRAPTAPRLAAPPSPLPPPALLGPHFPAPLPRAPRDPAAFVALSWNVAGLAALLRKDPEALSRLVASEGADALCIQEHKLQTEKKAAKGGKDGAREIFGGGGCGANKLGLPGWHITWACSTKPKHLGLSGVAIASRVRFLSLFFFGLFFSEGERERGKQKDGKPRK